MVHTRVKIRRPWRGGGVGGPHRCFVPRTILFFMRHSSSAESFGAWHVTTDYIVRTAKRVLLIVQ